MFHVPVGNSKNKETHDFDPHEPEIKYDIQYDKNTCVLSSEAFDLIADN